MAERKIRRAVELCPQLEIKRAHLIDTFLVAPAFTDHAEVHIGALLTCDTVVARTDHGQVVLVLDKNDGILHVDYAADEQTIHYNDTISYSQVVMPDTKQKGSFWSGLLLWIIGIGFGMSLALWLLRNTLKRT